MILVFGGTTEGKKTAEILDFIGEHYFYSTKTDVHSKMQGEAISGEMDTQRITSFCTDHAIRLMIDAAHPFALHLHQNIHDAATLLSIPVLRFERSYTEITKSDNITFLDSFDQLSQSVIKSKYRNILALTGVQTISALQPVWENRNCYFRILDTPLSKEKAERSAIPPKYIIPMNPSADFEELYLLAQNTKAELLLSKDSGTSGFMETKIEVSRKLGIPLWIVRRAALPNFGFTVSSEKQLLQQIYRLRKNILKKKGILRSGFTTGTCTTAAAKACFRALAEGHFPKSTEVLLPDGEKTSFLIFPKTLSRKQASCTVIKDGGDDADVTHGKEIGCELIFSKRKGIRFIRGKGIGKITLPGLQIAVGEPAINPTPRKMIAGALKYLSDEYDLDTGFEVIPFVPHGEILANQTFNSRLGVIGGISILGTTGKVLPYSNEAFLATIKYQLSVAHESAIDQIVLTSGKRSENMLRPEFPDLPDTSYIHYGNLVGKSIKMTVSQNIKTIHLGIMLGKAVKLAEGNLDTHSQKVVFNACFAAQIASECGYTNDICDQIQRLKIANAIRHIIPFSPSEPFYATIAERCYEICSALIPEKYKFRFFLLNDQGQKIRVAG